MFLIKSVDVLDNPMHRALSSPGPGNGEAPARKNPRPLIYVLHRTFTPENLAGEPAQTRLIVNGNCVLSRAQLATRVR